MNILELKSEEIKEITALIAMLKNKYSNAAMSEFIDNARLYASQLPSRVQQFLHNLKMEPEHTGITVIKGFPYTERRETPESWSYIEADSPDIDYFGVMASSCVGYVFGWSTQQAGKLIHDLIPQKNRGSAQTGYGSSSELLMHTEDSFHEFRAEYVCMFGIRNDGIVPTTLTSIKDLELDTDSYNTLYNKVCPLLPDESHVDKAQLSSEADNVIQNEESNIHTFYGAKSNPYICFDPAYTNLEVLDEDFVKAYVDLEKEIAKKVHDLIIEPGDVCIIDNRKVVHGRRAFFPSFDGTERWLKRINITTNLRRSAAHRPALNSRIIGL